MKRFLRVNKFSYKNVIIVFALLSFLGLTIYLLTPEFNGQKKQPQSINEIVFNQSDEVKEDVNIPSSISIVVIGLGLDKSLIDKVMALPKNITLGFSPYSPYLDYIIESAQKEEKDIIMNIPMDTLISKNSQHSFQDNGPYALSSELDNIENVARLNFIISKARRFNGYYTSIYDSFTDTVDNLTFVLNKVKEDRKYIMYNNPQKIKPFKKVATELGMYNKIIKANILADSELEKFKIESQLDELKNIADAYGYAIGIVRAYNISIDQVNEWVAVMDKNPKYNIISLSQLVNKQK